MAPKRATRATRAGTVRETRRERGGTPVVAEVFTARESIGVSRPVLVNSSAELPLRPLLAAADADWQQDGEIGTEQAETGSRGSSHSSSADPILLPERRQVRQENKKEKTALKERAVIEARHTSVQPMKFDYEQRARMAVSGASVGSLDAVLLSFPADDLEMVSKKNSMLVVARCPQASRAALKDATASTSLNEHDSNGGKRPKDLRIAPLYVIDALRYFTQTCSRTERRYAQFDRESMQAQVADLSAPEINIGNVRMNTPQRETKLTEHQQQERAQSAFDRHFAYMQHYISETPELLQQQRSSERLGVYHASQPDYVWESAELQCGRNADVKPLSRKPTYILFRARVLSFLLGQLEPFYCSAAIFSVRTNQRVSETFWFDTQDPVVIKSLKLDSKRLKSRIDTCLFTITDAHEDLYLVIKIQKALSVYADVERGVEPYASGRLDPTALMRSKELVAEDMKTLAFTAPYRQSFGWIGYRLFDTSRKLSVLSEVDTASKILKVSKSKRDSLDAYEIECSHIIRTSSHGTDDATILQQLSEHRDNPMAFNKKAKTCAGIFSFELAHVKSRADLRDFHVLNPMMNPLTGVEKSNLQKPKKRRPSSVASQDEDAALVDALKCQRVIRELRELPEREPMAVNVELINDLFVYPSKFAPTNGNRKWKHVFVRAQLRYDDRVESRRGVKCAIPIDSTPFLARQSQCSVQPTERQPTFNDDEMKFVLPTVLNRDAHIFFTFSHVNLKKAAQAKSLGSAPPEGMEVHIGHAVLRLDHLHELQRTHHELSVFTTRLDEFTPHGQWVRYLKPTDSDAPKDVKKELAWVDSGKTIFAVRINVRSSIYPVCQPLARFLPFYRQKVSPTREREMVDSMLGLALVPTGILIQHLPVILTGIFSSLSTHAKGQLGSAAVQILVLIIRRFSKVSDRERATLLQHFVWNSLDIVREFEDGEWLFESLLKNYLMFLGEKQAAARTFKAMSERLGDDHSISNGSQPIANADFQVLMSMTHEEEHQALVDPSSVMNRTTTPDDLRGSWLVFDASIRSMMLKILSTRSSSAVPEYGSQNRETFFENSLTYIIRKVMSLLLTTFKEISAADTSCLPNGSFSAVQSANRHLALFIRDLFTVMDRGQATELVEFYCGEIMSSAAQADRQKHAMPSIPTAEIFDRLTVLKLDFLKVISDYEHFIPLNLPFPMKSLSEADLKMPLVRILLSSLMDSLRSESHTTRTHIARTFSALLCKHEWDKRYQVEGAFARIAAMYFPLVEQLTRKWPSLSKWREASTLIEKRQLFNCVLFVLKNVSRPFFRSWIRSLASDQRLLLLFFEMLRTILDAFQWKFEESSAIVSPAVANASKSSSTQKGVRMSKKSHRGQVRLSLAVDARQSSIAPSRELLEAAAAAGASAQAAAARAAAVPIHEAQEQMRQRRQTLAVDSLPAKLVHDNVNASTKNNAQSTEQKRPSLSAFASSRPYWCQETSLVLLDTVAVIADEYSIELGDSNSSRKAPSGLLDSLINYSVFMLQCSISIDALRHLCGLLRYWIRFLRTPLFLDSNDYCTELSYALLRLCTSTSHVLRDEAASLLFLLIARHQEVGRFRRASVQLTTAVSKLVAEGAFKGDPDLCEQSLSRIASFARFNAGMAEGPLEIEAGAITALPKAVGKYQRASRYCEVEELVFRLIKILKDSIQVDAIKQRADPELVIDLYVRIARRYTGAPELRATWLRAIISFHTENGAKAEAAFASAQLVALMVAFVQAADLQMVAVLGEPARNILASVHPNIQEVVEVDEDVSVFTPEELIRTIGDTAEQFVLAELFELAILLHKLSVPLLERMRDYVSLAETYRICSDLTTLIATQGEKRRLGEYFRVGFYGNHFAELDGAEFIYHQPGYTHLFEFSTRLKAQFEKRFEGVASVQTLPDSSKVDRRKLGDLTKICWIQITSVVPYFGSRSSKHYFSELKDLSGKQNGPDEEGLHASTFERSNKLQDFVFYSPFTLSKDFAIGSAQGSVGDQHLRKNILVSEHALPFATKRARVIRSQEFVLRPIDTACRSIRQKNSTIDQLLQTKPIDSNQLQQILQGALMPQVNEGPIEIARVFLEQPPVVTDLRRKTFADPDELAIDAAALFNLAQEFQRFIGLCVDAAAANKLVMDPSQAAFQEHAEIGLKKLQTFAKPLCVKILQNDELARVAKPALNHEVGIADAAFRKRLQARRKSTMLAQLTLGRSSALEVEAVSSLPDRRPGKSGKRKNGTLRIRHVEEGPRSTPSVRRANKYATMTTMQLSSSSRASSQILSRSTSPQHMRTSSRKSQRKLRRGLGVVNDIQAHSSSSLSGDEEELKGPDDFGGQMPPELPLLPSPEPLNFLAELSDSSGESEEVLSNRTENDSEPSTLAEHIVGVIDQDQMLIAPPPETATGQIELPSTDKNEGVLTDGSSALQSQQQISLGSGEASEDVPRFLAQSELSHNDYSDVSDATYEASVSEPEWSQESEWHSSDTSE